MRGTVSLDFLFSIIVMLIIASTLFGIAFLQLEDALAMNVKYKAEIIAMSLGSSINQFSAINPDENSKLSLTINDPKISKPDYMSGGWPDFYALSFRNCTIDIGDVLNVTISYTRMETNIPESISAIYPIVKVSGKSNYLCNETINVLQTKQGLKLL